MRLSPIIKDKKVTCSNSSFELSKERKYATELIPVKSYQNSCGRYHKSFAKASKGVFTIANASVYPNASQYLPPHKQITKNLTILQTNRLSNPASA